MDLDLTPGDYVFADWYAGFLVQEDVSDNIRKHCEDLKMDMSKYMKKSWAAATVEAQIRNAMLDQGNDPRMEKDERASTLRP